jgi:hypothetical protein
MDALYAILRTLLDAPGATLKRYAYCLRERIQPILAYPGRNAFVGEITWLLWRPVLEQHTATRSGAASGAGR